MPEATRPSAAAQKRGAVDRFLDVVERIGNARPDPTTLFALLALFVIVMPGVAGQFDLSVTHPTTGKITEPVSLLSVAGLHRILTNMFTNFTSFAPLGSVKSERDVIKGMSQQMSTLGGYMVLVFFAAEFVAFFNRTNLGLILEVAGSPPRRSTVAIVLQCAPGRS
jgi:p-aminobenzoyl-glutamate transporter AbgT